MPYSVQKDGTSISFSVFEKIGICEADWKLIYKSNMLKS